MIEINPTYTKAYQTRGLAYFEKKKYKQAIADLSRVIKINPSDADAYSNRGVAYHEQGNRKQAIKDLEKAVKLYKQQGNQELYQKALNNLKKEYLS